MKNTGIVIIFNIVLFLLACFMVVNCNSKKSTVKESGYVNEIDTLLDKNTKNILTIERTFYRKTPTIHNSLIEFKQPIGETYVLVVVSDQESNEFALFVIEDFNEFIKNANYIMTNKDLDIIIDVDGLKSTSMRKSMSFEKGIFIRKESNKTPSVIFDLSEQSLKELESAYKLYINE